MRGIRAVVFDLDGTLLNTLRDLTDAVNHGLAAVGLPPRRIDEVQAFVGNGVERLMVRAVPAGTPEPTERQALTAFKHYYAVHHCDHTAPYPGIEQLLADLKQAGVAMAVVSNKLEEAVEALRRHFFADTIAVAVGDTPGRPRKPAPDGVLAALEQLGVPPEHAVYVGDSDVDIATARRAGMPCLSVSWGFREEAFLREQGAQAIVATPAQAAAYILDRVEKKP